MAKKGGGKKPGGKKKNQPIPQPQPQGQGGYYQYQQPVSQQLSQPYQDILQTGAIGAMPSVFNQMGQQNQMQDIYGQGAAQNLGGAARGMDQLAPLGSQYLTASGQNLAGAQAAMDPLAAVGGQYTGAGGGLLNASLGQLGGVMGLGGQTTNLGGGTLGQYGQLMAPNLAIQQGIANEIRGIQQGNLDVDPALTQQLGQQERLLNEQLRRQLGPDYATSSAGIEALQRFRQTAETTKASANFNRLNQLVNMQQGGLQQLTNQGLGLAGYGAGIQGQAFGQGQQATNLGANIQGQQFGQGLQAGQFGGNVQGQQFGQGQQLGQMFGQGAQQLYNQAMGLGTAAQNATNQYLNQLGATQNLYGNIPQTMGQFGQAMQQGSQYGVNAQRPYQQDRFTKYLNQYPTFGMNLGNEMSQSGDRWIQAAGTQQNMGQ